MLYYITKAQYSSRLLDYWKALKALTGISVKFLVLALVAQTGAGAGS